MSTPANPQDNPDGGSAPLSTNPMAYFLGHIADMRKRLAQGRELSPPHHQFKPRWDLHDSRLDEIERLTHVKPQPDWARIEDLNTDLLLDFQADMAASLAEASEGIVRLADVLAQRLEEKKFELPPERRNALEDLLEPFKDGIRDELLDALPIETRRKLEEEKRRLAEG